MEPNRNPGIVYPFWLGSLLYMSNQPHETFSIFLLPSEIIINTCLPAGGAFFSLRAQRKEAPCGLRHTATKGQPGR